MLCDNLQVLSSGFYDWDRRRKTPGARFKEDQTLVEQISLIHAEGRQTYGSPRIVDELRGRGRGRRHGRIRDARLLKCTGLCGQNSPPSDPSGIT